MKRFSRLIGLTAVLLMLSITGSAAVSSDVEDLTHMLNEFLANAGAADVHERFWADDLIYTSSRGTRTTKAEIMAGFEASENEESEEEDVAGPVYTAEDVQIHVYGDTAIVAFKLVATPPDASVVLAYFNTGTFLRRNGRWQVVAWQATAMPVGIDGSPD
jgi:ketosteroid isomerase-like protein